MEESSKYMLEDSNDDILFQMKWALREKEFEAMSISKLDTMDKRRELQVF